MSCWFIGVKWPDGEERAPVYFNGHVSPGWNGHTTHARDAAVKYIAWEDAQFDIEKLAPREFGEWQPVFHADGLC